MGLSIQKFKIDFKDGDFGGHIAFPIRTILGTFDLQVTQILPAKLKVNWPFESREEAQNRFPWCWPWRPSWISDRNNFKYCLSTKNGKRKVQGVPQSQTAALRRHQEEEENDKSKQEQIEQTYEKH